MEFPLHTHQLQIQALVLLNIHWTLISLLMGDQVYGLPPCICCSGPFFFVFLKEAVRFVVVHHPRSIMPVGERPGGNFSACTSYLLNMVIVSFSFIAVL